MELYFSKVVYCADKDMNKLIASRHIPAFTQISHFKGKIKSLDSQVNIEKSIRRHSNGMFKGSEYIIENQTMLDEDGDPTIIVPIYMSGKHAGKINPIYMTHALFANEPSLHEDVNAVLAPNYDKNTVTLLSVVDIPENQEILTCYGSNYDRTFLQDGIIKTYETNSIHSEFYEDNWFYIFASAVVKMPRNPEKDKGPIIVHESKTHHITHTWQDTEWHETCEDIHKYACILCSIYNEGIDSSRN